MKHVSVTEWPLLGFFCKGLAHAQYPKFLHGMTTAQDRSPNLSPTSLSEISFQGDDLAQHGLISLVILVDAEITHAHPLESYSLWRGN